MNSLQPNRFSIRDIATALGEGWRCFLAMPGPSVAFAALFVLIGAPLLAAVGLLGVSPLILPLAGGFVLLGPSLLAGFFELIRVHASGARPRALNALDGFIRAPGGLWLLVAVCAFLFLIWITDTGVLYGVLIGGEYLPYELPWLIRVQGRVLVFELWVSLMGAALGFIVFAVSAFSVPLLFERRTDLVGAVSASVQAVLGSFATAILWGMILSLGTIIAILLLPLLLVVLPVLAYASYALYRLVFPLET